MKKEKKKFMKKRIGLNWIQGVAGMHSVEENDEEEIEEEDEDDNVEKEE